MRFYCALSAEPCCRNRSFTVFGDSLDMYSKRSHILLDDHEINFDFRLHLTGGNWQK